ncbi:MAG: DUF3015 family protein [Bdellovibrionales bacterium]|nr:DUF3015 family protein [Bdellovibrionales bacterium]
MKKLAIVVACALLPFSAFAADTGDGCGIGWEITKDRTLIATTTRGTTNAFVPPTFGMTSGTIGCEQHAVAMNDQEAATYAYTNFDALKSEMAVGQGENLEAFAQTLGCSSMDLGQATKANYGKIYKSGTTSPAEMVNNVKQLIKEDAVLASQCNA